MIKNITETGVVITEHKQWNTKKVYTSSGYLGRIYRYQPKEIFFKSEMVNDLNQHLCGGWTWVRNTDELIKNQLLAGKKPLGAMNFSNDNEAVSTYNELSDAGLVVRKTKLNNTINRIVACHPIKLGDIGPLYDLTDDYEGIVSEEEVVDYCTRELTSFIDEFTTYNNQKSPLWVTGLFLGYPIENTISLYLESIEAKRKPNGDMPSSVIETYRYIWCG